MIPDIKDVKPPLDEPSLWWLWLLVAALLVVIAAVAYWWLGPKKKKETDVPRLPPWEEANQRLADLHKRGLVESGQHAIYYTILSGILRRYIEDRFHIKAPEMTTEEFIVSLKLSAALNEPQKNILTAFLTSADMVKFAKLAPSVQDAHEGFNLVKQFIDSTHDI